MHINVRDILVESVGYSRTYKISSERPSLEAVILTRDIEGEISISRLDNSLLVRGHLTTEIQLECHRCLSTFSRPAEFSLKQEYAEEPEDEQMPFEGDIIDIAPLVEQEIILGLPIKILCHLDCPGIKEAQGRYTKEENIGVRLADKAHITKGTKRGRT